MARAAAQRRIYAGDGPPERPGRGVLLRRQGEIPPAKPSARLALTTTSPRPGLQPLGLGPSLSACASGCQSVSVDVSAGSQWPLQRPPPATEHPPRPDVAFVSFCLAVLDRQRPATSSSVRLGRRRFNATSLPVQNAPIQGRLGGGGGLFCIYGATPTSTIQHYITMHHLERSQGEAMLCLIAQ